MFIAVVGLTKYMRDRDDTVHANDFNSPTEQSGVILTDRVAIREAGT